MYKITIEQTQAEQNTQREWRVIGKEPLSKEAYERAGWEKTQQYKKQIEEGVIPLVDKMGYVDAARPTAESTRKIYEQSIESMDLQSVIRAVNGV